MLNTSTGNEEPLLFFLRSAKRPRVLECIEHGIGRKPESHAHVRGLRGIRFVFVSTDKIRPIWLRQEDRSVWVDKLSVLELFDKYYYWRKSSAHFTMLNYSLPLLDL